MIKDSVEIGEGGGRKEDAGGDRRSDAVLLVLLSSLSRSASRCYGLLCLSEILMKPMDVEEAEDTANAQAIGDAERKKARQGKRKGGRKKGNHGGANGGVMDDGNQVARPLSTNGGRRD